MTEKNCELQKYYENRFDMFSRQGWKDFSDDLTNRLSAINNLDGISTIEKMHERKGEIDCLRWILSLPEMSRDVYDQLTKDGEI